MLLHCTVLLLRVLRLLQPASLTPVAAAVGIMTPCIQQVTLCFLPFPLYHLQIAYAQRYACGTHRKR